MAHIAGARLVKECLIILGPLPAQENNADKGIALSLY